MRCSTRGTNIDRMSQATIHLASASPRRAELAFGEKPFDLVKRLVALSQELMPPTPSNLWRARDLAWEVLRMGTRRVRHAPVEQRISRDPDLGRVLVDFGPPPMWDREPGFATLVHIILEQQVSLASANAAFARLIARVGELTPLAILESSDAELRADGFSRQKAGYVRGVAREMLDGDLDQFIEASLKSGL